MQYIMILHAAMQCQRQNMDQTSYSQKTSHILPLWVSYGISFVWILEKFYRVIMAPHCKLDCVFIGTHFWDQGSLSENTNCLILSPMSLQIMFIFIPHERPPLIYGHCGRWSLERGPTVLRFVCNSMLQNPRNVKINLQAFNFITILPGFTELINEYR